MSEYDDPNFGSFFVDAFMQQVAANNANVDPIHNMMPYYFSNEDQAFMDSLRQESPTINSLFDNPDALIGSEPLPDLDTAPFPELGAQEVSSRVSRRVCDPEMENVVAQAPEDSRPSLGRPTSNTWRMCATCGALIYGSEIKDHSREKRHPVLACTHPGCNQLFVSLEEQESHLLRPHAPGHGRVNPHLPFTCNECGETLENKAKLRQHGQEQHHSPFACECGQKYARLDVLQRHLDIFGKDLPKYPCPYCKRHRGENGFRRKDKLVQHIKGYHKFEDEDKIAELQSRKTRQYDVFVCPHKGCTHYRGEQFMALHPSQQAKDKPFAKKSDYTKHMKDVHDTTEFPCDVPGCDRVGRKGYANQKALIKHRGDKHPDAAPYVPRHKDVASREIRCPVEGCWKKLKPNCIFDHILIFHRISRNR